MNIIKNKHPIIVIAYEVVVMLSKKEAKRDIITLPMFSSMDLIAYIFVLTLGLEKLLKYFCINVK